jgi:nitrate/nitrite transporter NarK
MGGIGALLGIATFLFVKEPLRGGFLDEATKKKEEEKKEAKRLKELNEPKKNPVTAFFDDLSLVFKLDCAKNVLIASSLRNFGGMIVSSFLPVFFGKNFPAFKAEYAVLNAAALSICGLVASLAGGILADKLEKKSYMSKAWICISGCILSFPLIAIGTL